MLTKFQAVAEAGAQVVKTDIPSVMLGIFVDVADKARKVPITRLDLVPPEFNPARPDYAKIQAAVAAAIAPPSSEPDAHAITPDCAPPGLYRSACSCHTFCAESVQLNAFARSLPITRSRADSVASPTTEAIASASRSG